MAGKRRGKELGGQDKGNLVGKKHKTNDFQLAHSTALPPPGRLRPVSFSMIPHGEKHPFGLFRSAVWQCPLLAFCEPQASLLARRHEKQKVLGSV